MSDLLFIDGAWVPGSGEPLISLNPATGSEIWRGKAASGEQVREAVAAAKQAFQQWRATDAGDRIRIAEAFRDIVRGEVESLASLISAETGKPRWDSRGEAAALATKVDISIEAFHDRTGSRTTEMGSARSVVRHRPLGVMAVFGPYNFPMHLPNGHIVPALLAGNTVVFKPSELTPACGSRYAELWEAAGLPAGVLNLVHGARPTGEALVASPDIDGLLFTGSAATGKLIHEQLGGRPDVLLALEMGGNNPLIVTEVDDVEAAVYHTIQSAYLSSGQRCTCARRLLVPADDWGDRFLAELTDGVQRIVVGSADDDPEPFMGPVISAAAADQLLAAQSALVDEGAVPLVEMARLSTGPAFLSPGLLDVSAIEELADEEYFGPLLLVQRYENLDEAITLANATRFGLSAGIFTDSPADYERFVAESRAGIVNLNRPLTGASSSAPFGGTGDSGNHRPAAYHAADYVAYPVASLEMDELDIPEHRSPGLG